MWTITESFTLTFTIPVNIPWRCPLKTHVKPYYKSLNHLFSPVFPIYFPYISRGLPMVFPGFFRCSLWLFSIHARSWRISMPEPWSGSSSLPVARQRPVIRSFVRSFVSYGGYEKMKKQWKYNRYTAILSGYVYIYIYYSQTLKQDFHIKKTIVSHCFLVDFLLNPIIEVP